MNDTNRPRFRATHVMDSTSYDASRGTHRTKQVHYVLQDGTKSYIEMPHDQYNPDNVQRALEHAANTHEQVMTAGNSSNGIPLPVNNNPWGNGG